MTCLDAWAVLAWLEGEAPACDVVDAAIRAGACMAWPNAVEAAYVVARRVPTTSTDAVIDDLAALVELELPTAQRLREVARLKAAFPLPLGDCFAVATAAARAAPLLTGDAGLLALADRLPCAVVDPRAP